MKKLFALMLAGVFALGLGLGCTPKEEPATGGDEEATEEPADNGGGDEAPAEEGGEEAGE